MEDNAQKPKVEEWQHWAGIVMERYTTMAHVYDKPPHEDIFMPEKNLHARKTKIIELLHRMHALIDETAMPSDSVPNAHDHDERTIAGLSVIFQEVLEQLPAYSTDMQKLMKSRWDNHCNGRIASELFRGRENENEGIGTGSPEHGRLPAVLLALIDREQAGDSRKPREELLQQGEPRRQNDESRRNWSERNSSYMRSAGRME